MYYEKRLKWFRLNSLKANPGKFKFMILGYKTCYKHILKINSTCVHSSDDVTLFGLMIDKNLTFKKHNDNLVCKAQYKLHALRRIGKIYEKFASKIGADVEITMEYNLHHN